MYKKVLALVLAAVLLSGCDRSGENADSNVFSESSSPTNSDISESASDSLENSAPEKTGGIPEEISDYINSLDNGDFVFVDYTFDEDPELITFIPSLNSIYGIALAALQETDDYKSFSENYGSAELFGRFTENAEDYLDQNGEPMPIFKRAITDDFDGDGADESFVMMAIAKIPDDNDEERWYEREYLFFVNESGAVLIDDYFDAQISAVLDYGCCKQLIVASEGWSGTDSKSAIWGVQNGNAVKLYGGRLDYSKTDCFLYSMGHQFNGDFAVYDIDKGEYLAIQGKEITAEDIYAMDTDNVIRSAYNDNIMNAVLLGGKYFLINADGAWTYENGRFERSDKKVRRSRTPGYTGDALNTLDDVDYDAAVASMIAPEDIGKNTTRSSDEKMSYQLYEEVFLNQKLLKSMEQDRLYVKVNLHIDEEALRAEYEEIYPELDYYSWGRFLSSSGDQVIKEFVRDYDIDYEELESVFKMGATFYYELDKDTIALMLNDARVAEIIYSVGGYPVIVDF